VGNPALPALTASATSGGDSDHRSKVSQEVWVVDQLMAPPGELVFAVDAAGVLCALDWADHGDRMRAKLATRAHPGSLAARARRANRGTDGARGARGATICAGRAPAQVRDALRAYFAGELTRIDALPVVTGGTPFQRAVWTALRAIPPGTTVTYQAIAACVGAPRAARAVGLANRENPIGIVVPCHRVIGASGALTGYAGGIERKKWLVAHEAAVAGGPAIRHGG
jgi:methylated-DNA-[protein]-cysteine S-methyltransferase